MADASAATAAAVNPKRKCTDGKNHRYGPDELCVKCGFPNPWPGRSRNGGQTKERAPRRLGPAVSKVRVRQSIVSLCDGVQKIAIGLNPDLQPDELSAQELALLADALADEVDQNEALKKWLLKVQKQSAHMKLAIVVIAIAMPRLARRGLVPDGSQDLAAAVAMAAGGSPDSNRGDKIREEYTDGGGDSPLPEFPGGDSDEDRPGSEADPLFGTNGHEDSPYAWESEVQPDRTQAQV